MMKLPDFFSEHWRKLLGIFGVLFAIYLFSGSTVTVDASTVTRGDFVEYIEEDGKTRAKDIFVISSPVDGTLSRLTLKPGDSVKKHDVVAVVSPSTSALLTTRAERVLQAQVGRAKADLSEAEIMAERAKVAHETAQSELRRKELLSKKGFVSETELEQEKLQVELRKKEFEAAKYTVRAARHEVIRAEAELENVKTDSNNGQSPRMLLHAPIDGHVIRVLRESHGSIQNGAAILEIANLREMEVVVELLSQEAVKIPNDAEVLIKRWGGTVQLKGKVRLIEPGGFTKISALGVEEQRVNVIINFISPYAEWKNLGVGFRVDTHILIHKIKNQLLVPTSALFRDGKSWAVFVNRNGRAHKQVVEISRYNSSVGIVEKGLNLGEKVIIYPPENIRDGTAIKAR